MRIWVIGADANAVGRNSRSSRGGGGKRAREEVSVLLRVAGGGGGRQRRGIDCLRLRLPKLGTHAVQLC